MGCTSSVPNLSEIAANTAARTRKAVDGLETTENDKTNVNGDVKEDKDTIHDAVENNLNDANVSNVLPTCDDSLEENIQLARNSDNFTKIQSEEQEQDNELNSLVEKEVKISEDECEQNKFSTLKDVADQVILSNIFEDIDQTPTLHQDISNDEVENVALANEDKSSQSEECKHEKLEETESQENIEESTSPSQSDGNRSTRWEALADIAAELPPSLAVDPITGQIYSLTK